MPYRVLIVEDDMTIAGNLYAYFDARGMVPDAAYDGIQAKCRLQSDVFEAVVLDIGLPGACDGMQVLRWIREELGSPVPVLLLTARDALKDKLSGFAEGADDYLTKPFALAEVHARIVALIQRAEGNVVQADRVCGPLRFDPRTQTVTVYRRKLRLNRKSTQILTMLMRDPGAVVTREHMQSVLWGATPPSSEALRSQLHLLRRALAEAGFDGIETVHGVGWRLKSGEDDLSCVPQGN